MFNRKYKEEMSERKLSEIAKLEGYIGEMAAVNSRLFTENKNLKSTYKELVKQYNYTYGEKENLKKENERLDDQLRHSLSRPYVPITAESDKLKARIESIEKDRLELTNMVFHHKEHIKSLKARNELLEAINKKLTLENKTVELDSLHEMNNLAKVANGQYEDLKAENEKLKKSLALVVEQQSKGNETLFNYIELSTELLTENKKLEAQLADYDNMNAEYKREYKREYKEHEELKKQFGEYHQNITLLADELDRLKAQSQEAKPDVASDKSVSSPQTEYKRCPACEGRFGSDGWTLTCSYCLGSGLIKNTVSDSKFKDAHDESCKCDPDIFVTNKRGNNYFCVNCHKVCSQ
jgi:hypothetical protein